MKLDELLQPSAEFESIIKAVSGNEFPINIVGTSESQKAHLVASLMSQGGRGALVVTASESSAMRFAADLSFFTQGACTLIPPAETTVYKVDAADRSSEHIRMAALKDLEKSNAGVVSLESFLCFVMPKNEFTEYETVFSVGGKVNTEQLAEKLVGMGYTRLETIDAEGQFAVRGGIIDIYSPGEEPIRMELFDDEIDSVRVFDVQTQISIAKKKSARVIPARLTESFSRDNILSYVPENWFIVFDEPARISEAAKAAQWEMDERIKARLEQSDEQETKQEYLNSYARLLAKTTKRPLIGLAALSRACPDYRARTTLSMSVHVLSSYGGNTELLYGDLRRWRDLRYKIILLSGSVARGAKLTDTLTEQGFSVSSEFTPEPGVVCVLRGSIDKGFEYPLIKTVVISDREIFAAEKKKRRRRSDSAAKIKSVTDIEVGDYVVHNAHGIGRYLGIVRLEVNGVSKDYLKIVYRGDDFLYIPVNQLDLINKYVGGGEGKTLRLNKLGGAEWSAAKARVKKSVEDMAQRLIELYAARSAERGVAFSPDTPWQRQFEDAFEYEETPDQLRATEEVKADMLSQRPMDRLLLGDVGFGKTEVAMRGAFKAVTDGYQVAYLVPTTILASQHYNNFVQRMRDFPITVRMLSRFCTQKELRDTKRMLKSGECDIVVGTHKLLWPSIEFKKLGLLIVDEEQRFGVAHKERIKELKKNVDVLTLSATPIPRTLHMAMIGIRDMSVLENPPEDRYPVQTYVLEYNHAVIKNAIERELARGGQVYYLSNRVRSIDRVAVQIQQMVPEAKIGVGHGRMGETQLEDTMIQLMRGEINVLVCTTIIETGLDIPNVNTIIIEDADRFGLAQLYQLRGRVGRTNRLAYAYLTFKRDKALDEIAEKRLRAIKEFTEFGSGFKIAMRDLEIRGAGNILGAEQHGFMATVGYEMYCRLLEEAVREAMGDERGEKKKVECTVDINVSAFIPESYISSATLRIEAYKKIAAIEDLADSYRVEEELEDRYGDIPTAVRLLIDVALIRVEAAKLGIEEIGQSEDRIVFRFNKALMPPIERIASLAALGHGKVLFNAQERPYVLYRVKNAKENVALNNVNNVLQHLQNG
ncbi:MAG: transcription-repair coupling factor [Clostridia bacterium]|nr:transcription-repair coupling factor [Clostridia bacterium]